MADYDRQILVPYLRDVCSAEMLCAKLEKDIRSCNATISGESAIVNRRLDEPRKPNLNDYLAEAEKYGHGPVPVFIGVGFVVLGLWLMQWISLWALAPIGFGAMFIWIATSEDGARREREIEEYNKALENYNRQLERIRATMATRPQHERNLQTFRRSLGVLKEQLSKAQKLRDSVYSVNIIPSRYRNIHAAYYLYDYFNTCRESDLDKVIQTMLLDEIKQRLGDVIAQNQEIILNQRYQIAMQEEHNRAEAERHRESMRRMARMEQNQEKQMDYQQMIMKNQEVTNFFLEVDFFRKERRN